MSLLQGTNTEDERTAELKAEKALKNLQLSSPCGWFWHAHGDAAPAVSAGTFLDKGDKGQTYNIRMWVDSKKGLERVYGEERRER